MPRALRKGKVIAESDTYETVEGNIYFPPAHVKGHVAFWRGVTVER